MVYIEYERILGKWVEKTNDKTQTNKTKKKGGGGQNTVRVIIPQWLVPPQQNNEEHGKCEQKKIEKAEKKPQREEKNVKNKDMRKITSHQESVSNPCKIRLVSGNQAHDLCFGRNDAWKRVRRTQNTGKRKRRTHILTSPSRPAAKTVPRSPKTQSRTAALCDALKRRVLVSQS